VSIKSSLATGKNLNISLKQFKRRPEGFFQNPARVCGSCTSNCKGRKKLTASNSTELQHFPNRELDFTPFPASPSKLPQGGAESVALPPAWHCATPRCTRCHWSCFRCRSRTRSCSRTRWSSRSRRWNGSSQLRVPPVPAGCCGETILSCQYAACLF